MTVVAAVLAAGSTALGQGPGWAGGGGGAGGATPTTELTTFETQNFAGSGICAACHSGLRDANGNDVSMDTHWRSTMMANASKDPLWQAKIESEVNRNLELRQVIEDKCSKCHMPMARTQAVANDMVVGVLGTGFLSPDNALHAAARDAISCSLCHQIQAEGLGEPSSFTGGYVIDTSSRAPDRLTFGKFQNVGLNPMRISSGFTPVYGAQTMVSGMCGSCHTLYTPMIDAAGNVVGEFPEQMTYPEWEHSDYGRSMDPGLSCQGCHMPLASGAAKLSNRPVRLPARSPFHQHHLVGGNTFVVGLLGQYLGDLGVTATVAHLDATEARIVNQLTTRTGGVSVASSGLANDTLRLDLLVENRTGHKLPSGIPLRQVWIHLTVTDGTGQVLFESGAPLADGRIEGNDADTAGAFEPHYDLITSADQVQIYEPVMADTDGALTWTFLRAASYLKDNRLLPLGFDKATAPADIAVWGAAANDANFLGGSDLVRYAVDVAGAELPLTVSAELLYQAVSHPFLADLRLDQGELVQRFVGYYDQADKSPVLISSVEIVVQ